MILFHRTSIAEARDIVKLGFTDEKWAFNVEDDSGVRQLKLAGVWLSDRPLSGEEGPEGDAVLEVDLDLAENTLERFEIEGVFWDARLWVVPADVLNPHANAKFHEVDPRSSWFHDAVPDDDEEGDSEEEQERPSFE